MFKRVLLSLAALSIVSFAFTGGSSCGSSGAGGGSGGGSGGAGGGSSDPDLVCAAGTPATTFTKVYTDVFPSCNNGSCHKLGAPDGSDSYGKYDTQANAYGQVNKLSLYAGTAKTLKVVDPNHPENSSMWLKVIGHAKSPAGQNVGASMPSGGAQISAALKQTLKDWICSGAAM